jgi:apolipoprotein N-acyltransferase
VAYTAIEFGHLPWPIGVLVLFLFAALANLHIVIPGVIFYIIHSHRPMKPWQVAIFLPLSTVLLETWVPMIFPWNFGYPWYYARWPIYQIADTVGFVGLSAFTLLLNGILFWGWLQRKKSIRWKSAVATALSLFVLLNIFGWWKEKTFSPTDSKLRIAMVQANIGNLEKQIAEHQGRFRQEISDKFFRLSRQALSTGDVDLLLWPETAFPDFADDAYEKSYNPKRLRQFIQEIQTPLLTGAYSGDHGSQRTYNALFLFNSKGELVAAPYRKTILLAFGEYLPGASYFPILSQWIPMVSQFDRGSGPTVWTWNDLRLGLQICYEGLFPDFSRELSQKGAQIFFNVTNDSWFATHFEPLQHLYMTAARAVEFRRPVIRTTNTGISTAILADGRLLNRTPQNQEAILTLEVPYHNAPNNSFFQLWGQYIPFLLLLILLLSLPWQEPRTTDRG